jgi:PAS domain S-box-containing protein
MQAAPGPPHEASACRIESSPVERGSNYGKPACQWRGTDGRSEGMIWESTLTMAAIDVVIAAGAATVVFVSFRHRATILRMEVGRSVYSIAAGACIIAALYLTDLFLMLVLPQFTTHQATTAAMKYLHLNWSWIAVLAGLSFIVAGLVPLLGRLFPRIEVFIRSLEVEIAERKRAETRLHDAHDRLESRVERRTADLAHANEQLVREIAERKRVASEIRRLNEDLERLVGDRTAKLRESEEQLRLVTDNVPAVIAYVDANRRYRFVNRRYEEWFGISSEEVYGRHARGILGEANCNAVKRDLAIALTGKQVSFEARIQTKDDGPRDIQSTYVPHFSNDGTIMGIVVLATDITERKRLESELLRRERLATLGQLTATVSHELRNPLGVIQASAYTLRDGLNPEAPRAARALERVERSVVRCNRIIGELLDFTRVTGLEPESAVLDDWLASVLDEQAFPAGLVLHREFGLPNLKLNFDRDRLRRAVINVFDNACQAMLDEENSKPVAGGNVLTVRTQTRAGRVEVVFEDQGTGISAEVCERIFEPLYSTKSFGVGLGLPVVKQIMEQHGGGIEVETATGRGTSIRLWLDPEANFRGAAA